MTSRRQGQGTAEKKTLCKLFCSANPSVCSAGASPWSAVQSLEPYNIRRSEVHDRSGKATRMLVLSARLLGWLLVIQVVGFLREVWLAIIGG
jgi:hypothetical protein